jgi:peptidoglycan/xylan/chitin deacetylase (PgdA/CDA1 family)
MSSKLSRLGERADITLRPVRIHTVVSDTPLLSFTFDDFPRSALDEAGKLLEARNLHGTYYTAFGLAGQSLEVGEIGTADELASCARRGHELGCHTYRHLRCSATTEEILDADIERNVQIAATHDAAARNFSYPYGDLDRKSMEVCSASVRLVAISGG